MYFRRVLPAIGTINKINRNTLHIADGLILHCAHHFAGSENQTHNSGYSFTLAYNNKIKYIHPYGGFAFWYQMHYFPSIIDIFIL